MKTKDERVVTERKCGGVEDVTGCTLYNSKISRKVCSESCPGGECLNTGPGTSAVTVALILLLSLRLF
ncbi:hypothetical protein ANCDUO_23264 [Ancylostoma duodenale]|uniref:Uncharacterized protein n=1 Tax=Ancylostoma duodenale TaxID=51022 RepID=A0A0C2FDQ4_9BILA|nr:hypothetical protein ANCDUO_23264 [Ancylostoma duodenale]